MNKLKFNDYSELSLYIDEHPNEVESIIYNKGYIFCDYVISIIKIDEQYFCIKKSTRGETKEFYEVEIIAELKHSIKNDLNKELTLVDLWEMFKCYCCVRDVKDDCIKYLWLKEVK